MLSFAFYILKVIICSAVLFGYYWFFLRNKIFHSYNRFYLLAIVALSLFVPMLKINIWHKTDQPQPAIIKMLQVVNSSDEYMDEVIIYSHYNHISKEQVFTVLYFTICTILLLLLIQVLFRIWFLLKNNAATQVEDIHFIKTNAKGTPFSFLKFIFWNDAIDIETKTGRQVFKHEVAHVQEKHSYDKLFINIVLIVYWCNPFFWFIRKELNMIHEFIADKKAVEDGDTADFAAMILQATYPQHRFPIANNFFYSPIKRRLAMLTKNNKNNMNYISRLLVLPIAIVVFAAFTIKAKTYTQSNSILPGKTITVMIDAGHGGADNGAVNNDQSIREKEITLSIAKKIKELNQAENIKIILSRETDIYQTPQQKAILAREADADLFISIHLDGEPKTATIKRTGLSVFVATDEYSNSQASKLLASSVISSFKNNYELAVADNLQQRKGIWVLRTNSCPSVLIEAGCINNDSDLDYLKTDKAVATFAKNVLKAIANYAANENISIKNDRALDTQPVSLRADLRNTDSAYLASIEMKTKALVIINSKIIGNVGYNYFEEQLSQYASIKIFSPAQAVKIYGEKGKYGAIEMKSKDEAISPKVFTIERDLYINRSETKESIPTWIFNKNTFTEQTRPLYILNGKSIGNINGVESSDNITDIRILTAKSAMPVYGEKGISGAIIINTQKNAISKNSLLVLDGKIYENKQWEDVMAINGFKGIERIEVLEKEEAIRKYGFKGKNGAIIATTRAGVIADTSKYIQDTTSNNKIFTKTEIEPDFPGGKDAWQKYLVANLDASMPVKEGWPEGTYTIVVQFIVDKNGHVSDVKTDDKPGSKTAKQCVNLVQNGPSWVPARQNGRVVKAYKKQPITFVVSEQ